jgi:magnesium transporter
MRPGIENAIHVLQRDLIEDHPDDAAQLLERLPPAEIADVLSRHPITLTAPVWERLAPDIGWRAIDSLEDARVTEVLRHMSTPRVAAMLRMADAQSREARLVRLPTTTADELRAILSYPADSAGALMDPRVLLLRPDTTVHEALSRIRALRRRGVRMLFVVNAENRLEGQVDIQDIATASGTTQLEEIQRPVRALVTAVAPREEVVNLLDRYRLTDLPVVDAEERLIGVVRYRNLMAAAEDEATVRAVQGDLRRAQAPALAAHQSGHRLSCRLRRGPVREHHC